MDEDLCLQYETFIPFAFLPLAFALCKCTERQCSLTLATASKSTTKAIAPQQKSLEFLAKVVLDNSIAFDYLLAKHAISLCHSKYLLL